MKRIAVFLFLLCVILTVLPLGVPATEVTEETLAAERQPGMCGEALSWHYDGGTLTISGSGDMDDFEEGMAPWQAHKDSITKVVLSGSVTSVGACAFTDYDAIETVVFGDFLHTIGKRAFKSCDNLTRIILPETFRKFDEECFMSCRRLGEIWCRGGMPSFKASCIWDISATIFYPPAKAWPAEYVIPLGDAFRWQIQFQTMDVPEEYLAAVTVPTVTETVIVEETEAVAEPVPTGAAATEATLPETVPTEETVAVTEEETLPEPTKAEPTLPAWLEEIQATEPPVEEKSSGGMGIWVFGVIFSGVILFILLGALIFRRRY